MAHFLPVYQRRVNGRRQHASRNPTRRVDFAPSRGQASWHFGCSGRGGFGVSSPQKESRVMTKSLLSPTALVLVLAMPATAAAQSAPGSSPSSCPPGSWFCAEAPQQQATPAGQPLEPLPDADEPPPPPPPPPHRPPPPRVRPRPPGPPG